ncbi:hypothetical protein [Sphingomonas sp. LHG3406-1]|uniref:hypothetical protein n=1 Tax=Sphingomonas sp. LHG3406-1 TaxID=2804617 RepID=UPI002623DE43|nr:hypothetical protein [Sphingomonas sp. LHG3406-1]
MLHIILNGVLALGAALLGGVIALSGLGLDKLVGYSLMMIALIAGLASLFVGSGVRLALTAVLLTPMLIVVLLWMANGVRS